MKIYKPFVQAIKLFTNINLLVCACVSVVALLGLAVTSFGMLEYNEYGLDLSHITKTVNNKTYSAGIHFLGVGHEFLKFPRTV